MKQSLQLTWAQKVSTYLGLIFILPANLLWKLALSPFTRPLSLRPWRRRLFEASLLALADRSLSPAQMKLLEPRTTGQSYADWVKSRGLPECVTEIAPGLKILSIGNLRGDSSKVILYLHGGGFLLPVQNFALDYWWTIQKRLGKSGINVPIAMLEYSLSDRAAFPTQLQQVVDAFQYLFKIGYEPSNIILVGDSAGGNLIFQTLLHILNPSSAVDQLLPPPGKKLAGVLAVSPWFGLTNANKTGSWAENKDADIVSGDGLKGMANVYLEGISPHSYPYLDTAMCTPATWFDGIDAVVDKILITAGEKECCRDDIIKVGKQIKALHPRGTTIFVQADGLHVDAFLDVPSDQSPPVELTEIIYEWLKEIAQ